MSDSTRSDDLTGFHNNVPESLYEIPGFKSQKDVDALIKQLGSYYPSEKYNIKVKGHFVPDEYSAIIPEGSMGYLEERKKTCVLDYRPEIIINNFSPRLFRFMEEKYIDEFLSSGSLFISSFKRCLSLENPDRKDVSEGFVTVCGFDGQHTIEMCIRVSDSIYLLCTSLSENNVFPTTEYCYCLEILDSYGFVDAVTRALISSGYEIEKVLCGPCNYGKRIIYNSKINMNIQDAFLTEKSNYLDHNKIFSISNEIAGDGLLFRKSLNKSFEHEFRIIWIIKNIKEDHIIIKAPDAIKYCQKTQIV